MHKENPAKYGYGSELENLRWEKEFENFTNEVLDLHLRQVKKEIKQVEEKIAKEQDAEKKKILILELEKLEAEKDIILTDLKYPVMNFVKDEGQFKGRNGFNSEGYLIDR